MPVPLLDLSGEGSAVTRRLVIAARVRVPRAELPPHAARVRPYIYLPYSIWDRPPRGPYAHRTRGDV
ncbi:hypothetical protein [Streptomyces sp. WMMC897]|uniref:hypothetical protein n=1 Tax=Streptomyces sp. WMMC897 TaxID=3014782 RepID=UPI0022B6C9E6|nr:hypothetical protein [Streptomyces sp. WMMC897]MCZ7414329.1 hypothetical protein [Streptomyces sp. WMMC897]